MLGDLLSFSIPWGRKKIDELWFARGGQVLKVTLISRTNHDLMDRFAVRFLGISHYFFFKLKINVIFDL